MKNIHILPTDNKPSRLYFNINDKEFQICEIEKPYTILKPNRHIYITNDEEIKEWNWMYDIDGDVGMAFGSNQAEQKIQWQGNKKIILTTDQDLIKDGVQAIDDEFLEWFVRNPSCERVEVEDINNKWHTEDRSVISVSVYKIILPKDEETKCYCGHTTTCDCGELSKIEMLAIEERNNKNLKSVISSFIVGYEKAQETLYSEEEVKNMINDYDASQILFNEKYTYNEWFKQFKKK